MFTYIWNRTGYVWEESVNECMCLYLYMYAYKALELPGLAVDGDGIVVVNHNQTAQFQVARQGGRLGGDALHTHTQVVSVQWGQNGMCRRTQLEWAVIEAQDAHKAC